MELSNFFDAASRAKKEYTRCLDPVCRDFGLTQNELAVLERKQVGSLPSTP